MTGYINKLGELLNFENNSKLALNPLAEAYSQKQIVKVLQAIHKTRDINLIMTAENAINEHELQFYSINKISDSSIKQSLASIDSTNNLIRTIQNEPDKYINHANLFQDPKNIINGLPNDDARQFFKSQSVRFVNMYKIPTTKDKQNILDARKVNIRLAGDIYTNMQQQVLGKDTNLTQIKGKGL